MTSSRPQVHVGVNLGTRPQSAAPREIQPADPFRILVVGDFSGRQSRGLCAPQDLASRRPMAIDRDDFDAVMAAMAPKVHVPFGTAGDAIEVACRELDDFHPDALYRRVDAFDRLRRLRDRLRNPTTAAAAIAEMTGPSPTAAPAPSGEASSDVGAGAGLLESALLATESAAPAVDGGSDLVSKLVREFVTPHAIPRPDSRVDGLVADVERGMGAQMRAILSSPAMQRIEAAWRSLDLLVRRLDTDSRLQIHLLDVTWQELSAVFAEGADRDAAGFARHLIDPAGGTHAHRALVVVDHEIGADAASVAVLDRFAALCHEAGSVLLSGASSRWVGCQSFAVGADPDDWTMPVDGAALAAWQTLREQPHASALGLVLPRFLLRVPYGARSSPATCFPFEEEADASQHDALLWGNAAHLVALMLAQTFSEEGWSMRRLASDEVSGLPLHVRRASDGAEAVPVAEVELTSRGAERIGGLGMMPLFSVRGADAVRLGALRAVAGRGAPLGGRWGGD